MFSFCRNWQCARLSLSTCVSVQPLQRWAALSVTVVSAVVTMPRTVQTEEEGEEAEAEEEEDDKWGIAKVSPCYNYILNVFSCFPPSNNTRVRAPRCWPLCPWFSFSTFVWSVQLTPAFNNHHRHACNQCVVVVVVSDPFCYRCGELGHMARDCEMSEDGKRTHTHTHTRSPGCRWLWYLCRICSKWSLRSRLNRTAL